MGEVRPKFTRSAMPEAPHLEVKAPELQSRPPANVAPDITISRPTDLRRANPDVNSLGQGFQAQADSLRKQIDGLKWYQKIPGFSAKPELQRQQALHAEAAQHVQTPQEATLADALIKLPPKNRPQSIQKALEMTRAGDALLPEVVSGQRGLGDATKERVAQLQWSLYNKAIQQLEAQAQAKGTTTREPLIGGMTVLDDGGKVAQFMQGVKREGSGTGSYARPSSHFTETRNEKKASGKSTGLGMDFTDPSIPLPAGKKTLLFGTKGGAKEGTSSTYLKGEYSGYDKLGDRLGHATDFIKTNILGIRDPGRREKFIPKDIQELYKDLNGPPLDPKQLKAGGISYMLQRLPERAKQDFANFVQAKGYNDPSMRKGEEIIVPHDQLGAPPTQRVLDLHRTPSA